MEDDDGDTTVISENVEEQENRPKVDKQDNDTIVNSAPKSSRTCSSNVLEDHIDKSKFDDNVKNLDIVQTTLTLSDESSKNNKSVLLSDSDVPKSPKKVNGEVESSKCDEVNQKSEYKCGVSVIEDKTSSESEDSSSETEKNLSNGKCVRQLLHKSDVNNAKGEGHIPDVNTEYKDFKKKTLAETSSATNKRKFGGNACNSQKPHSKYKESTHKKAVIDSHHILVPQPLPDGTQSSAQLTEYAQYLGLQPTVKFKCYKCGESGFPSMQKLNKHQRICLKNMKLKSILKPKPPSLNYDSTPSTNFRITRKVYLCSACGTYYENWNLFLHMREVHKRHICLFCLGMFSQADKLATHLSLKHGVVETLYNSSDHFLSEYKGACFLMCCTCERIFTERENFYEHPCKEEVVINVDSACSLCGLRGAHFPTCRRAFTSSSSPPSNSELTSEPLQNSQTINQDHSVSAKKYLGPLTKKQGRKSSQKVNTIPDNLTQSQEKSRDLSDIDDDYDISNAASFCHVNIHEPSEKSPEAKSPSIVTSEVKSYKNKTQNENSKKGLVEVNSTLTHSPKDLSTPSSKTDKEDENISEMNGEETKDDSDVKNVSESNEVANEEQKECQLSTESSNDNLTVERNEDEIMHVDEEDSTKQNLDNSLSKSDITNDAENNQSNNKDVSSVVEDTFDENMETDKCMSPEKQAVSESPVPEEESKPSPKADVCDIPQTMETKQSATEADSESESSGSGDDTEESSSSTEISSEDNDHHDESVEKKDIDKVLESDADNADSDKMSLVVDENRSEEEYESFKENNIEGKDDKDEINESDDMKQDDQKSDNDMTQNALDESEENKDMDDEKADESTEVIQLAGDDVALLELTLEENLDAMSIQLLLKESVKVSCGSCVYCNHAKKIAVNGKQLALHLLAEHRFAPVVCSDSGELTEAEGFVDKLKLSLLELQQMYFNTDSYDNMDETCTKPYDRTYECFHCHFMTTLHKDLYVHNRKMHQKTILLCIMCKSNFYSYSELLCHLCPGIYVPDSNISFRCCLCAVDGLPSAFRLMVHLRKRHHACDVCLETTGDQQKLSNHVWKHKLHHLCYRCGIAYRNKPDITKHLFWKHGTESVSCKKCLQKKWPHVYHFCIPPNAFVCEECNSSFSRAVALKVHKRLHVGDLQYPCDECEERFISRKLLVKHQEKHKEIPPSPAEVKTQENQISSDVKTYDDDVEMDDMKNVSESHQELGTVDQESDLANNEIKSKEVQKEDVKTMNSQLETVTADSIIKESVSENASETSKFEDKDVIERKAKLVDVDDIPPLNLSSDSDDTDDEGEKESTLKNDNTTKVNNEEISTTAKVPEDTSQLEEDVQQPIQVVDGIWDNFKTYKENLERRENQNLEVGEFCGIKNKTDLDAHNLKADEVISVINMDHDYCGAIAGTSHKSDEHIIDEPLNEMETDQNTLLPNESNENLEETKESVDEEMKACDADHNYCYTNTTSLSVENEKEGETNEVNIPVNISPSKKKQKSPKKKQKRSASSSSSDSSSNSDSSSCSCGTNCSCTSSSSSSSGGSSSSQSSDSDSSSSEGRRRQAARRERRRERAKKRRVEIEETEETACTKVDNVDMATNGPSLALPEDNVPVVSSLVEPEDVELSIRESDLDTDETETDEDFYDKYPQKLANKILAEKRNQLLLLAAVAPVNNGTMSQSNQSPPSSTIEEPLPKKKTRTKRRKKSQQKRNNLENKVESKLHIPTNYYNSPVYSKTAISVSSTNNSTNPDSLSTPSRPVQSPFLQNHPEPSTPTAAYHSTGSGSETDSKRLSKRKRVPKRFYGDSSDEEGDQPPVKWKKVVTPIGSNSPAPSTTQPVSNICFKNSSVSLPEAVRVPSPVHVNEEKSDEEDNADDSESEKEDKKSSTDSSNSESDHDKEHEDPSDEESDIETPQIAVQANPMSAAREGTEVVQQKNENLYCYCQCPYDEVSEMIACDGKDCTIEWFHFECVGIMVPPKGKWFCPDCRKRASTKSEFLVSA